MTTALHHRIDGPDGAPVVVLGPSLGTDLHLFEPPDRRQRSRGCFETVAGAACFLASDAASAITGINLPDDAGWLVAPSWRTGIPPTIVARSQPIGTPV